MICYNHFMVGIVHRGPDKKVETGINVCKPLMGRLYRINPCEQQGRVSNKETPRFYPEFRCYASRFDAGKEDRHDRISIILRCWCRIAVVMIRNAEAAAKVEKLKVHPQTGKLAGYPDHHFRSTRKR